MSIPIDKVRGEGNCGRATDRGEEACECVRKYRPDFAVGRILTKAARLRTETSYKAGSVRRVSTRAPTEGWSTKPFPDDRSRLDGLLRLGVSTEVIRSVRSMASASDSHVLLEAVASPSETSARTHPTRRSDTSSHSSCT